MLTDKQIRDEKPKNTVYRLRDTQSVVRGFGVVIAPSGAIFASMREIPAFSF